MAFFLFLLVLAGYMLKSYVGAIIVGALFAYFLFPLLKKIQARVKSKRLTQIILSILSVLILILILTSIVLPLIKQTQGFYTASKSEVVRFIENIEGCDEDTWECSAAAELRSLLGGKNFAEKSQEFVNTIYTFLLSKVTVLLNSIVSLVLFLVIMIFSVFYFLGKGEEIKKTVLDFIPLDSSHKLRIMDRLEETIKAVIGGNVATALLQGFAGGLIFFLLGISAPLFWGLLMAILAFIPLIGPGLIWIPAAVILIVKGSLIKGIILIIFCLTILGPIDNFLKPKLIGDKIKMSSFVIFLGVIGGLHLFGILGLFFGPIILALIVTCGKIYQEMNQ